MSETASGQAPRYRAFISYSHRDAVFGRRLHRRLEGYVLPRRLSEDAARRLTPIFRDRDELSAARDLSAEVRAALADSACLIVVCSPAAVASPWVSREIDTFRALHPDRPVLAALAAGQPGQAFPAALAADGVEPLAADFRREGDGSRLALLKLVAGIAGVGLDALVQRDAQRRIARVMAVTAAALAAMLAMTLMTIVAVTSRADAERQRAEAERQRAKAEELVEFMLTDLRENLKGVGRLDVLTAANRKALDYYAGQDLERLPPTALEQRARILQAMGEDDERRGELDRALAQFVEARRTTSALLDRTPADPQRIFAHAQSEYWVAFIDWRRERFSAAQAGFQRYAALANRLLAADPNKPEWRMEAGYAQTNLGALALRDRNDPASARDHFLKTLVHFRAAASRAPDEVETLRMIADTQAWLADSERALGRFEPARASRREEASLLRGLQADDPRNAVYARDLLGNALGMAQIDLDAGQPRAAATRLADAYAQAGQQARADPADQKIAKQKIVLGAVLARASHVAGAPPAAAAPLLADCRTPVARADAELRDICALVAALTYGPADPAAWTYVRAHQARLANTRRTARWGLNLSRLLKEIPQTEER